MPIFSLRHLCADSDSHSQQQLLAIYGRVLLGIGAYWAWAKRSGQPPSSFGLFTAGMLGVLAGCIAFFGGGSVYSLAKYGAFDKAIGGNLWGLLVFFWGILGALVIPVENIAEQ